LIQFLLRPLTLIGIAFGAFGVLLVVAIALRSPDCTSTPTWADWLFWFLGPLSVVTAFGAACTFGIARSRSEAATVLAVFLALVFAAVWAVVGAFILLGLSISSGCFE